MVQSGSAADQMKGSLILSPLPSFGASTCDWLNCLEVLYAVVRCHGHPRALITSSEAEIQAEGEM